MSPSKMLYVTDREKWRSWLQKHHESESEIWLIFYKKQSGRPRIPYDDAVEEALCFGWIDSIVKRIDDEKYAQRFTPRRDTGTWSESNRIRLRKLIDGGRMTPAGLAKIAPGALEVDPQKAARPKELPVPAYLTRALKASPKAWQYFQSLAPSYRRDYVHWITTAKREETRERRIKQAIELLEQNQKLGPK